MSAKKQVAKTETTNAIALPDMAELPQGAGMENQDADSFTMPVMRLLQKGSPQADPDNESYVDGAKAGCLYDTVSGEVIDPEKESIRFIPVFYNRKFIEWILRENTSEREANGSAFVAEYTPEEGAELMKQTELDDKNRDVLPNGHQLNDTRIHYIIVVRENGIAYPAMIQMDRTQVKRSKRWFSDFNRQVTARNLRATFQLSYAVGTEAQQKDGNTWRIWDIKSPVEVTEQKQFDVAFEFFKAIRSGDVEEKVDDVDADTTVKTETPKAAEDGPQVQEAATF